MTITLSDYDKLLECKGNKHNKIYIVRHRESRKRCILKIIDIYAKESQLREIEVHKKLNHKYIIKLLDYEFKENKIVMLIELAKHGDLYGLLPKIDELGENKILKMYYKILKALQYLHSNNYVHRDIKPENILITKKFKPKLADFGTSVKNNIIANTFCGTYEYMAPEVYLRCKQNDKVDVWAVGILLYEIMHKRTPFRDDTLQSIKEKLDTKTIYFKIETNELVKDFIYYALKFNPKDRPSISDLLNHKLFDNIHPKADRTSTVNTQVKAPKGSLKDLDGMRTQSQPKNDSPDKMKVHKLPVHTEIFDTEYSSKNIDNFNKKVNICATLKKLKGVKAIEAPKKIIPSLTKILSKPKLKPVNFQIQKLKKLKTLQSMSSKPDIYDFFSAKKKPNILFSLNNFSTSVIHKNVAPHKLVKAPSIEKQVIMMKNTSVKRLVDKSNWKGFLYNLYEKKEKVCNKSGTKLAK